MLTSGPAARDDSDRDSVASQLGASLDVSVRRWRESHPHGSTRAVETLYGIELSTHESAIPIETDTIPVEVTLTCVRSGVTFEARFSNPRVSGGTVIYQVELL